MANRKRNVLLKFRSEERHAAVHRCAGAAPVRWAMLSAQTLPRMITRQTPAAAGENGHASYRAYTAVP